jgi:hypothetical protein
MLQAALIGILIAALIVGVVKYIIWDITHK